MACSFARMAAVEPVVTVELLPTVTSNNTLPSDPVKETKCVWFELVENWVEEALKLVCATVTLVYKSVVVTTLSPEVNVLYVVAILFLTL